MRLIFVLFFLALPSAATAFCGPTDLIAELDAGGQQELADLVAPHPFATGNVWRAEMGESTIHVIGTFHLDDPRFDDMMPRLAPILSKADTIYLESSAEDIATLEQRMLSEPAMLMITAGPTLIDMLGEEDWATYESAMTARGIPGFMAAKMQPWYASMMLSIPPCAMTSAASQNGLDQRIITFAEENSIPNAGLEDPMATLTLFTQEDTESQLEMLRASLVMNAEADAMYTTMVEAYFDGRHREIWEFNRMAALAAPEAEVEGYAEMFQEMEDMLLTERNLNWMEVLLPATTSGSYVVAVGAGHLAGQNGVLNLLAEAGYVLYPVE